MLVTAQPLLGPIFEDHLPLDDLIAVQGWAHTQAEALGDDIEVWYAVALQRAAAHHAMTAAELLRRIEATECSSLLRRASYAT